MVKAVLRGGVIYPLNPLPSEWHDGLQLRVEQAEPQGAASPETIDSWYAALDILCAAGDAEDEQRLSQALAELQQDYSAQAS